MGNLLPSRFLNKRKHISQKCQTVQKYTEKTMKVPSSSVPRAASKSYTAQSHKKISFLTTNVFLHWP